MTILGLTSPLSGIHDNGAVLLINGDIVFASSEERFTRKKHEGAFPSRTIEAAFRHANIGWNDIDIVAAVTPRYNIFSMIQNEKVAFLRVGLDLIRQSPFLSVTSGLRLLLGLGSPILFDHLGGDHHWTPRYIQKEWFPHHLTHAASAYYIQPHTQCLVLSLDGYGADMDGNWLSGVVFDGRHGQLTEQMRIGVDASLGLFYQAVTVALGFAPNDGEGKTMGLAAYGKRTPVVDFLRRLAPHWDKKTWRGMPHWREFMISGRSHSRPLFLKTPSGSMLAKLLKKHGQENVAWAAQHILEEEMVSFVSSLHDRPIHLVCAGGIFLNVKMNQKLRELPKVSGVFVQPHAGDGGLAFGAALLASISEAKFRGVTGLPAVAPKRAEAGPAMSTAALGVGYTNQEMLQTLQTFQGQVVWERPENIAETTADLLTSGKVVGWFQGRAEWGPRALGYRSVLADPRDPKIKDRINTKLKQREWFMPFAPSVLAEEASKWFVGCISSPFMTMAYDVNPDKIKQIPAVVHVDGTARPNTVTDRDNPLYYHVIKAFQRRTGIPLILNTSFNRHGLPIVNSPIDAIEHLLWGCVDTLVIGPWVVRRKI